MRVFDRLLYMKHYVSDARHLSPYVECLLTPAQMRKANWGLYGTFGMFFILGVASTAYLVTTGVISAAGQVAEAQVPDIAGFVYRIQMWISEATLVEIPFLFAGLLVGEFARKLAIWHYFMTVHRYHSFTLPVAPAF